MEAQFFDQVLRVINNARIVSDVQELTDIGAVEIANVHVIYKDVVPINDSSAETKSEDEAKSALLARLEALLTSESDDETVLHYRSLLLNSTASHIDFELAIDETDAILRLSLYNVVLELPTVSPMIDGDLVVQGAIIVPFLSPAICVVEYADNFEENFQEVTRVAPWQMMVSPAEDENQAGSFMIPISIGSDYKEGSIHITVYVGDMASIPYSEEENEDGHFQLDDIGGLTCALDYTVIVTTSGGHEDGGELAAADHVVGGDDELDAPEEVGGRRGSAESDDFNNRQAAAAAAATAAAVAASGEELVHLSTEEDIDATAEGRGDEPPPDIVLKSIKIASDYDELMALRTEGYDLICEQLTESGAVQDQEHQWKFFVCGMYGPPEGGGVEDVIWVKTPKAIGTLPVVKDFVVYHDFDLTELEDHYSVYIAVKIGVPRFTKLIMMSCDVEMEALIKPYLKSQNAIFRKATVEICNHMGCLAGLVLVVPLSSDAVRSEEETLQEGLIKRRGTKKPDGGEEGSRGSHRDDDEYSESRMSRVTNSDIEDEDEFEEEEIIQQLLEKFDSLKDEKQELHNTNSELQKRCVTLIQKEKTLQIQNSTVKTSGGETGGGLQLDPEQLLEKEKLFNDMLEHISEGRVKLSRQQNEFDQLAQDLQTRLDDKEFKAGEIGASFKEFKREILSKAVNSRTGKSLSKRLITQFELIEQKREEDLERNRLKNIQLRTQLRKLERALRSKEHLAEGLHMIDFEQLKIENQTLNEKIEERNEELAKLKRKKTVTVQVLTHTREKLRFIEQTNHSVRGDLEEVENQTLELRSFLAVSKRDRDVVKEENKELRRKQGFATSDLLLVDFESRKTELESIRNEIMELRSKYNILARQAGVTTAALNGTAGKTGGDGNAMTAKLPLLTVGRK